MRQQEKFLERFLLAIVRFGGIALLYTLIIFAWCCLVGSPLDFLQTLYDTFWWLVFCSWFFKISENDKNGRKKPRRVH